MIHKAIPKKVNVKLSVNIYSIVNKKISPDVSIKRLFYHSFLLQLYTVKIQFEFQFSGGITDEDNKSHH